VNVTEGDSVIFTCETDAEPPATVIWLRNTLPLNGQICLLLNSVTVGGLVIAVTALVVAVKFLYVSHQT